jgi:hypothetical protein
VWVQHIYNKKGNLNRKFKNLKKILKERGKRWKGDISTKDERLYQSLNSNKS